MILRRLEALTFISIGAASVALPLGADDLAASSRFLCTAWHAAHCTAAGVCEGAEPWRLNIPDFVRLDLDGKLIATTTGSSQARATPIDDYHRTGGRIFLSGRQAERAWSWVINEASGEGTLSISSEGAAIAVFSACTPIENLTAGPDHSGGEPQ